MTYKRYMVFGWTTYDNVKPLQCVLDSYDYVHLARDHSKKVKDEYKDDKELKDWNHSCVFDRIEGKVI